MLSLFPSNVRWYLLPDDPLSPGTPFSSKRAGQTGYMYAIVSWRSPRVVVPGLDECSDILLADYYTTISYCCHDGVESWAWQIQINNRGWRELIVDIDLSSSTTFSYNTKSPARCQFILSEWPRPIGKEWFKSEFLKLINFWKLDVGTDSFSDRMDETWVSLINDGTWTGTAGTVYKSKCFTIDDEGPGDGSFPGPPNGQPSLFSFDGWSPGPDDSIEWEEPWDPGIGWSALETKPSEPCASYWRYTVRTTFHGENCSTRATNFACAFGHKHYLDFYADLPDNPNCGYDQDYYIWGVYRFNDAENCSDLSKVNLLTVSGADRTIVDGIPERFTSTENDIYSYNGCPVPQCTEWHVTIQMKSSIRVGGIRISIKIRRYGLKVSSYTKPVLTTQGGIPFLILDAGNLLHPLGYAASTWIFYSASIFDVYCISNT